SPRPSGSRLSSPITRQERHAKDIICPRLLQVKISIADEIIVLVRPDWVPSPSGWTTPPCTSFPAATRCLPVRSVSVWWEGPPRKPTGQPPSARADRRRDFVPES